MLGFQGEILILTGTPGAGKSTTAEALAHEPGSPKVHLHSDDFWGYIKNGRIPPYLPESQAQNAVVIEAFTLAAERFAKGGYFVVLDGIIGPWFFSAFRGVSVPLHYIVLRPPLDLAIRRCQARGGDTLGDSGPITQLHEAFSSLGELEQHVIETRGRAREEVLRDVIEAVESGRFRLNPLSSAG